MTINDDTLLYSVPPSFYSQIARLALTEKGVKYRKIIVAPGPPNYETYQPWYMRLNPMGTVPTLVVNGKVIDDSRMILNFSGQELQSHTLFPSEEALLADVENWIEEAYQIPERELAYGSEKLKKLGATTNRKRLKILRKYRSKQTDMKEIYDNKIADIESFMQNASNTKHFEAIQKAIHQKLDWANQALSGREFCCGKTYSAADVVWTVTVARQVMLGNKPFEGRPYLEAWYARMKARPSYRQADVWERFKPEVMLPILLWKYKWSLLVALTLVTLITLGLIFGFGGSGI